MIGQTEFVHTSHGVTTADEREGTFLGSLGNSLTDGTATSCELIALEYTCRTVPQNGLGTFDSLGEILLALRTSVNTLESLGNINSGAGDDFRTFLDGHCTEVEAISSCAVAAEHQLNAVLLGQFLNAQGNIQLVELNDRITDLAVVSLGEGVGHTAAEDQLVNLAEQVLDDTDLGRNLRTTHDGYEGALDVAENGINGLHFLLHQIAQHAAVLVEELIDNGSRSVLTVSSSESIHHVSVGIRSQLLGEFFL